MSCHDALTRTFAGDMREDLMKTKTWAEDPNHPDGLMGWTEAPAETEQELAELELASLEVWSNDAVAARLDDLEARIQRGQW